MQIIEEIVSKFIMEQVGVPIKNTEIITNELKLFTSKPEPELVYDEFIIQAGVVKNRRTKRERAYFYLGANFPYFSFLFSFSDRKRTESELQDYILSCWRDVDQNLYKDVDYFKIEQVAPGLFVHTLLSGLVLFTNSTYTYETFSEKLSMFYKIPAYGGKIQPLYSFTTIRIAAFLSQAAEGGVVRVCGRCRLFSSGEESVSFTSPKGKILVNVGTFPYLASEDSSGRGNASMLLMPLPGKLAICGKKYAENKAERMSVFSLFESFSGLKSDRIIRMSKEDLVESLRNITGKRLRLNVARFFINKEKQD